VFSATRGAVKSDLAGNHGLLSQPLHCSNGFVKIDLMDIARMPEIAPFAVWIRERDEPVHRESQC
jgi:hypothetical protein